MRTLINAYFVPKGHQITTAKDILGNLIPKVISSPFVRSGQSFDTNHKDLGYDPFHGIRKELVLKFKGDDNLYRFEESKDSNRRISIVIP